MSRDADDAIPMLRALKYYPDDPSKGDGHQRPRDDVLIHFTTQRASVTPPESLPGDCTRDPSAYEVGPLVLAELRNGAVVRDGSFVFTERDELLRESVDRLSTISDLSALRPNLGAIRPEPSPESAALLGCQRTGNYFHWWIDVLAKCWALENSPYRTWPLVTPPLEHEFQRESLRLLKQRVTPMTKPLQRFQRVVFARGLTTGSAQSIAPQVSEFAQWCRAKLELPVGPRRRKLFLSRRSARRRRLIGEDEIVAALGADFEPVELEALSVREQAILFSQASLVVAPHGAGLTNLLFCARPTAVIELVHADAPPDVYRRLAGLLGHPYIAVGCKPATQPQLKPGQRDMRASAVDVARAVAHVRRLRGGIGP